MTDALDAIEAVDGYLYAPEAHKLYELARGVPAGCVVEIGSYRGRSTIMLAQGAREAGTHLYAIDPHLPAIDGIATYGAEDRVTFCQNVTRAGVADVVRKLDTTSVHAAAGWSEPIGLLWIDGAHDYDSVSQDVALWSPHILPGGLLVFHDSGMSGVAQVQRELSAEWQLTVQADSTRAYTRKRAVDVSVLIPYYNHPDSLLPAVLSAWQQPGVRVQVVVCDDASTVPAMDVLKDLQTGGAVGVVTHDENKGQAAALNTAAMMARGRYLIELDADDTLFPGALAAMVKALDDAPAHVGFAYGAVQYTGTLQAWHRPAAYRRVDFLRAFPALYPFMYRRAAWDAGCRYAVHTTVEGKPYSVQDWDMALQMIEWMRYDGLPLPDVPVLRYHANETGVGAQLKAQNGAVVAGFKARWPQLQVIRL